MIPRRKRNGSYFSDDITAKYNPYTIVVTQKLQRRNAVKVRQNHTRTQKTNGKRPHNTAGYTLYLYLYIDLAYHHHDILPPTPGNIHKRRTSPAAHLQSGCFIVF